MKPNRLDCAPTRLTCLLLAITSGAGCGSGPTAPTDGEGGPRIGSTTVVSELGRFPSLSAGRLAYFSIDGNSLVLYDIRTRQGRTVFRPRSDRRVTFHPAISRHRIVWAAVNASGSTDIRLYDIEEDSVTVLSDTLNRDAFPSIAGEWAAWRSSRPGGGTDIEAVNLLTADMRRVTDDDPIDMQTVVAGGGRVVWSRQVAGSEEFALVTTQLETGEIQTLAEAPPSHFEAATDGERIVWIQREEQGTNVMVAELSGRNRRPLTSDAASQVHPDISGRYVVWEVSGEGGGDIVLFDLSTSASSVISPSDTDDQNPAIEGRWLAWEEWSAERGVDLVLAQILD